MLTFTDPHALWLLLAIPLVVLAQRLARTNFNPRQRALQTAVRALLLAALALAVARPVLSGSSARQSVVYAVDVSHSVASHAVERAAQRIEDLQAELRPAHSRILAFGKTAMPVASAAELRGIAGLDGEEGAAETLDRAGTDLEAALLAARGELAPGHVPRIVLFTDGQATAGDARAALIRLAADQIPVSIEPLTPRTIGDAWIDALDVPERVPAGGTFAAAVRIGSQREGIGTIVLRSGTRELARQPAAFAPGMTPVALDVTVDTPGEHVVTAQLEIEGDQLPVNNTAVASTWAEPRPKVLYVEGVPASARYLAGALTGAGFDVEVRAAAGLPASIEELHPFDVVILSDVARAALPDAAMTALAGWVEKAGGGLLVAGGESVFGEGSEGGYRRTPIERLTPVTFERQDEPEVALVIVLDRSWSMAGASMELTKTAAQAAVDVLADEQSIGILTFNDKFAWDVPLTNVGRNRDEIREKIAAIGPGGHTLIFPAVEQAYLALRDAKARARHVILLSDGRSYPGEYEELVKRMVAARITLSTVAVGPSADPELLRNLADWGRGRAYVVADATAVPEIFVKEAKNAATPAFDEKPITPIVRAPAFLGGVDLSGMPALKGRTATVLKDDALELIGTDEEDPLLAFWPFGLGRTAVFTSDVKDRWAADWLKWRGYGPFFAAVVRSLERQPAPPLALEVSPGPVRGGSRTIDIAVEARDPDGGYRNMLSPAVRVTRAGAAPARLTARQVAPGRYEATVVGDAARPITISLDGAEGLDGVTARTILPDPAAEYRFRPPDEPALRAMAAATGGAFQPTADALANRAGDRRTDRRPLWPALLWAALFLWFVDLLLRRVRLFEGSSQLPASSSRLPASGSP